MNYYNIRVGSFRFLIIESPLEIGQVIDYVKSLGWREWNVQKLEFGTLHEIPKNPAFKG